MNAQTAFLDALFRKGGLHDCRIVEVSWQTLKRVLRFEIADINGNFLGLSEYPGAKAGCISLFDVESVSFEMSTSSSMPRIFEMIAGAEGDSLFLEVKLVPSGSIKVQCGSARLDEDG